MRAEIWFSTFPPGHFCGNARSVENSYEFTTSLWKTLRVSHITMCALTKVADLMLLSGLRIDGGRPTCDGLQERLQNQPELQL